MSKKKPKKEIKVRPVKWESGIEPKPVYGPEDLKNWNAAEKLGEPGSYPFTRGIHKLMYRARPFTMRQYAGFGTCEETNERFKFLISQGQTGLNVAFDLPTQNGYDSDHDMATGEVGRVGMAVDSLADFEVAFDGIPLDKITVSLTINSMATIMIAMYAAMAEKRGYDLAELRGTAQNDILKEFVGRGTWIYPVEPSVKLVIDTIEYCANELPKYSPVSVCGYHIRESGATPAQEMAYGLAIAAAYIEETLKRGIDIDHFASRLSFNFDIFGNMWEQIAKFRAGRRMYARMLKEKYGAKNPKSMLVRMIAGGGGGGLTIEQPENNIVRSAYYALASALSGTQTMALCSYDEAYTIPTEKAATISLRTMQLLVDEIGAADTVDPLAGSYFIESMTDAMEEKISDELAEIEKQGGMIKAVAEGLVQSKVGRQAYEMEKKVQAGEFEKIGVNKYRMEEEKREVELHEFDRAAADKQNERLARVRSERDSGGVENLLAEVRKAAEAGENVMPAVKAAIAAYATVGEIADIFRKVYGEFREPIRF
ncbi:MAG: acyl-CoA mutase large subunit family protein [Planctomycetota bacterium]|jgi:methylmalonyl-CoA mutase N-terminal domain/subunit